MHEPISYWIDDDDRIVRVNDAWTPFALANDAPDLAEDLVRGRLFTDFVVDTATRHLYGELLRRVRSGAPARFFFRCDSPTERRRLEMRMFRDRTAVCCTCTTLDTERRSPQPIWDRHVARTSAIVRACGWCKRIDVSGRWLEVEQGLPALDVFEQDPMPLLTHGICPQCLERTLRAL